MSTLQARIGAEMPRARQDLEALVACRSVADPRQFPAEECLKAAQLVIEGFSEAGMRDVRLEPTPDGHPAVYGHIPAPDGAPTVLLYCHYDVQPPLDPTRTAWQSPPFELTERDLLRADAIVMADTGNFALGVPTLTTTLRGLVNVVVTVTTLAAPVHSGMFGGPAPDALLALAQMLASYRG